METVYRKKSNGRYVPVQVCSSDLLGDGVWLVQTKDYSKSMTNLVWRLGDIKKPCDVVTHASLQSITDELSRYINRLTDESSNEYKEAKELYGGWMRGPIGYSNISSSDLCSLILRKIGTLIEEK